MEKQSAMPVSPMSFRKLPKAENVEMPLSARSISYDLPKLNAVFSKKKRSAQPLYPFNDKELKITQREKRKIGDALVEMNRLNSEIPEITEYCEWGNDENTQINFLTVATEESEVIL